MSNNKLRAKRTSDDNNNNDKMTPMQIVNYNTFLQELDKTSRLNENKKKADKMSVDFEGIIASASASACCDAHQSCDATAQPKIKLYRKSNKLNQIVATQVNIDAKINNITDLLSLVDLYKDDEHFKYNIDMHALHAIKTPLINLNNMIGMKGLKENIVDQILYYIQKLHKIDKTHTSADFMHTVIYGEPGTGKTEIAKIIGEIFANLGILQKGIFKKVTRSDLIAGYLGQTAIKTKDVIKECLDGVLFIDEAYALGNGEKRDSFSKECIDTLCEGLSAHKENLMVIIAGYENELNECFFNHNKGLESRFTWRFETEEYTSEELRKIFFKMVADIGWVINENDIHMINIKWFETNKTHFKHYGRDMESLLSKTKIAHSRRVFCLEEEEKKKITINDLEQGLKLYLKNKQKCNKPKLSTASMSMYS